MYMNIEYLCISLTRNCKPSISPQKAVYVSDMYLYCCIPCIRHPCPPSMLRNCLHLHKSNGRLILAISFYHLLKSLIPILSTPHTKTVKNRMAIWGRDGKALLVTGKKGEGGRDKYLTGKGGEGIKN